MIPVDIVDNISTAFGMAAVGLAATIAPAYIGVMARSFGLAKCRIVKPQVTRQVCIYHSANRVVSPAAEGFLEHLIAWFKGSDDPRTWGQRMQSARSA